MPIFDYSCESCGETFEELFFSTNAPPKLIDCHFCDEKATKHDVHPFRHVGPVFEDLDAYTDAFYSKKAQANGKRVRSYKDVQLFEQENGLDRITYGSSTHLQSVEKVHEEMHEMDQIKKSDGRTGVADYIYKKEMQDSTGWSDSKYKTWKGAHDVAKNAAEAGKVDISQAATALPAGTK